MMHRSPHKIHIIFICISLEHIEVNNDNGFESDNLLIGGDKNGSMFGSVLPMPTGFLSANS